MSKRALRVLYALAFTIASTLVARADQDHQKEFDKLWKAESFSLAGYISIYLYPVDVSEVIIDNWYADMDEDADGGSWGDIREVGKDAMRKFSNSLDQILPVESKKSNALKEKSLGVFIKLKGRRQETRFLMNAFGGPRLKAELSLECEVADLASGEKLLTIADTRAGHWRPQNEYGDFSIDDADAWNDTLDFWAGNLAAILSN